MKKEPLSVWVYKHRITDSDEMMKERIQSRLEDCGMSRRDAMEWADEMVNWVPKPKEQ